jgi:phosphate transport system ATP-binding protein
MTERTPLFEVRDLTVTYAGKAALAGVGCDIRPRRVTALIGPSGCGKTSFLQCLNRLTDLIPGCAVSGTVRFAGADVLSPGLDVVAHRRRVGMIFQKPNPFPLSVWQNVELALKDHGIADRQHRRAIVEQSLVRVGLWNEVKDRLRASARTLSGGQQQRLCLARALALEPEVLLMDEPCSALDPISAGVVEELIASLRERLTVVVVTHNLAQARRLADDVAVFWLCDGRGRVIEAGEAGRVFTDPAHPLTAEYVRKN